MLPTQPDDARRYLARVLPWPQPGESGFIGIHWTFVMAGKDRPFWGGRACQTLDQAIGAVNFALKGKDTRDIYVCLGRQEKPGEQVVKGNFSFHKPLRNQDNIACHRSLFLDLDFKGYDKPSEAGVALFKFLHDTNMPEPTMVVHSGGGLHVYWTFAQNLEVPQWQSLAYALVEATKQHGLKCDTQVTIDSARVLRVPGTFNRKEDAPRPVRIVSEREGDYSLERIATALAPYAVAVPQRVTANLDPSLLGRKPLEGPSELAAGIDTSHRDAPIDALSAVQVCPFIKEAVMTEGKDYPNPLWNLTTLLSSFMDVPKLMAHKMAKGHPGYSPESTDELLQRKEKEKEEKGLGWPSCATISATGSQPCKGCPHLTKGKTPFHFAQRKQPAVANVMVNPAISVTPGVVGNDLPSGYSRNAGGHVVRAVELETGETVMVPVCNFPMRSPWLQAAPRTLHFETETELGEVKQVSIPTEYVGGYEMRKEFQKQGLMLQKKEVEPMGAFLVSWITKLQQTKNAVVSTHPFGWNTVKGKLDGFVFAGRVWTPGPDRVAPSTDPVTAAKYAPQGEVKPWVDAAALVTQRGIPGLDAMIASSFGAPLVRFTNEEGVFMSVIGESGIGKSTALNVAMAVWGNPKTAKQGLTDTYISVMRKMGQLKSLPVYWDEIKDADSIKNIINILFELTRGRERDRATTSLALREAGTWQTLLASASNESLLDAVMQGTKTTVAGLYRIFEFEVTKGTQGVIAHADASRIVGKLNDNYGVVGLEYAKFLGANFARIEDEMTEWMNAFNEEVQAPQEERFWTALCACICMGAKYSNELGFTSIDEEALRLFMIESLEGMRVSRRESYTDMKESINASSILQRFLAYAGDRHTIRTNRIWVSVGKPAKGMIELRGDQSKLDTPFVHIGMDDKLLRLSSVHFGEWCREIKQPQIGTTKALAEQFGMQKVRGRIGAGTHKAGAMEYLLEIDLNNAPDLNFIDEA